MSTSALAHQLIRASAGSGKTFRLTNRYLALMAAETEPAAIVASTFTRKAAGEILNRVLNRLARAAGDSQKTAELDSQIGTNPTATGDYVALLRRLLPQLHRVRIGTMDSFFMALAGSFGLELGLPPGWTICEQVDDDALRRDALESLLEKQPEDISRLLPLLHKGETRRSVHDSLTEVISRHYEIYRESERSAWEQIAVPPSPDAEDIEAALVQLREFDFSVCKHKGFIKAQQGDLANYDGENWAEFLGKGLAGKVAAGEKTYYNKPIPLDALALYPTLIQQARSAILRKIASQTTATFDLLDRFQGELASLKRATGQLRFGEVTQALLDGLKIGALRAEEMGFRLDGTVEHLLLDEFQDTSLLQWRVLKPLARRITETQCQPPRSFFCVGDVKQAIYGWRGGMAEILDSLPAILGPLQTIPLDESRRSAQPIIDVVNEVFNGLAQVDLGEKTSAGLAVWGAKFPVHTTVHKAMPGYVRLQAGPDQEEESLAEHRGRHCKHVAAKIQELTRQSPDRSMGVLCRTNTAVARMIYELRQLNVAASEEGGNALTDSPAVELMLSLFTLADHPDHSVAWFHLQKSPLRRHVETFARADALAAALRRQLHTNGYGAFTQEWAKLLAPACDRRDLRRLQQLVEMAYDFEPRSTLRADAFVNWVRKQRATDPSTANVRVMTIHSAKGLQFDVVVLPELDTSLTGKGPTFVVGRDATSLDVNFVCRYADESVKNLLPEEQQKAFDGERQGRVEESLSLLYVAMTRAIHALFMFIPGERKREVKDAWSTLLRAVLTKEAATAEPALLFEHGDPNWHVGLLPRQQQEKAVEPVADSSPIEFRSKKSDKPRGLEHMAPSHREGHAQVPLDRLFNPSEGTGTAAGTLYHAWFATVDWLDDGLPTEAVLRQAAERIRKDMPTETWRDINKLLANFRAWLGNPAIRAVLQRSAYTDPSQPGFPQALRGVWMPDLVVEKVEQERPFLVRDESTFWNGSFDRVVWLKAGDRTVAADIIDYKTDAIAPGDAQALANRTNHYRPQLEAYRNAVVRLAGLKDENVAARLVFTIAGQVVAV